MISYKGEIIKLQSYEIIWHIIIIKIDITKINLFSLIFKRITLKALRLNIHKLEDNEVFWILL